MRALTLVSLLLVVGLVFGLFALPSPAPDDPGKRLPAVPQEEPLQARPQKVPPATRDVTPRGMTLGPKVTGPLLRVEPPEPERAPEKEPEPQNTAPTERTERLFRPVVVGLGKIESGKHSVRLAGIEPLAPDASCGEPAWPCGMMGRSALRRLIRARAIDCTIPAGAEALPETTSCRLGDIDLSEWLVQQGWAKAASARYQEAEDASKRDKRGQWSTARPGFTPDAEETAPFSADLPSPTPL
ncbi:endonuclease YncB(thermonuclease family) [Rhodopseudomonas julia]|uniref:Endonuclease YncB(Thermonuclease family) n=1 Tax=Rhodopseudomonas julia TaxID=200617 RepID=A0ABU0C3J7_9BRAD|nr:thermonuclease family protein [Rhodopseudomonas julia]MDQ0325083.1 endonuclease YncB(thermonuclease family) [Rhodopseudomonas julia]